MPSLFRKGKDNNPSKDELLNFGLKLAMEWGESWLKPIQERLSKAYPKLNCEELNEYNSLCQEAMSFGHSTVYEMAEKFGSETKKEDFEIIFLNKYPWVNKENASHLFSQGMYYAWKDIGF